jgi:hypothetical protein
MAWVSTAVDGRPDQQPVSLYLDLVPGQKADLEVVARAALAFSAAIKEAAFIIDPGIEISIELESGTPGSLSLNTIIRKIKETAKPDKTTLTALGLTVLYWFAADIRTYGVIESLNHILKGEPELHLSEKDLNLITNSVTKALKAKVASEHVQEVYRQLEEDSAIQGVGATTTPGIRPAQIVPRHDFPVRALEAPPTETTAEERTRTTTEHVILVSPVLLQSHRRWRVLTRHGEVGVAMEDNDFLSDIVDGRRHWIPHPTFLCLSLISYHCFPKLRLTHSKVKFVIACQFISRLSQRPFRKNNKEKYK